MDGAGNGELRPRIETARDGGWFMFRGPAGYSRTRVTLPIPGLPPPLNGLRFVHLTDLHLRGHWSRGYDELIEQLEQSPPDLLLITGDFLDDKHDHRSALPTLRRLLPRLKSRLGTFGILGNHDVDIIQPYLREMGVKLINGGRALLEGQSAHIELIGLPGLARRDLDAHFVAGLPTKPPDTLRIILSHYPDHFRRMKPLFPDIFLAGHTHGGQICFPGGRPLITHDRMPKRFCKGVFRMENCWYIVSRGFGFAGIPLRIHCPAEVAEITTVAAPVQ